MLESRLAVPPEISVVMSVFNGARALERSIYSIQEQSLSNFEFIIIDDGSTDNSLQLLERIASQDCRVRVVSQSNQGLTYSLNRACEMALAPVIARQDVGDVSHPHRLETQLQYLLDYPDVVAVGCGSRRFTVRSEQLGEVNRQLSPEIITQQLIEGGIGILHAASMFRKDSFNEVGGYRTEFRYAQDTDLWLRLSEVGLIGECPSVLFDIEIDETGISASRIQQQVQLSKLARQCHSARRLGESELPFLEKAKVVSSFDPPTADNNAKLQQRRRARYFIGGQLLSRRNRQCRSYLWSAAASPTLTIPALTKLALSFFRCR